MRTIPSVLAMAWLGWGAAPSLAGESDVTLHQTPRSGCCEGYADHLRGHGFAVVVKATDELAEMSRKAGIPDAFQGCHHSFVDGYVVSGHVPTGIVRKLLGERPDIGA